ncbi:tyrosine recombinase XerC [Streptomyces sp. NPDC059837]|uniref:site-specific integrase n=1 Tax=Streptomyces sp. NPDC059837 TaxID=3346968 RepID=UPI003659E145
MRWQARHIDQFGKEHRSSFDTWQEALDRLSKAADQSPRATTSRSPGKRVTFYAAQMIERKRKRNKRESTITTYEGHIRNHIAPFIGDRAAGSLRRADSTAFVDHLLGKPSLRSPRTVVGIFKTWRILMHYMVDEDVALPANIVSRIELPEVAACDEVALTPGQVAAVAAAIRKIEPRYEVLVWLAACAGLRASEAFALSHTHVGWLEDRICIQEQLQRGKAAPLKTKASYATLPVDHFLIEQLHAHTRRFRTLQQIPVISTDLGARRQQQPTCGELIVTDHYGRPVRSRDFNRKWRQAVLLAGLPRGTRFHHLKRFYTSTLGASGRHDPKTVQALSRHARFSETWDTYARPPLATEGLTVTVFSDAFPRQRD